MRIIPFLVSALALSVSIAHAQDENPAPEPAAQPTEVAKQPPANPGGPLKLPPVGDVQNFLFAAGPALGAVAGLAAVAGGGGSTTSTTSTVNN